MINFIGKQIKCYKGITNFKIINNWLLNYIQIIILWPVKIGYFFSIQLIYRITNFVICSWPSQSLWMMLTSSQKLLFHLFSVYF